MMKNNNVIMERVNLNYTKSLHLFNEKKYDEAFQLLLKAWDLLPESKYECKESFLIALRIIELSIETNNVILMNEWEEHFKLANPRRPDFGEREMWLGKIAYANNDLQKAKKLFLAASKKSQGRCFGGSDHKYRQLIEEENELMFSLKTGDNFEEVGELSDKLYTTIVEYCKFADGFCDKGKFKKAIKLYKKAWDLLPEPKEKWEAAVWIYSSVGDAYFFMKDYHSALYFFKQLYDFFEVVNEFVLIRYGECLWELGLKDESKKYIFEAYMLGGRELFIYENSKYLSCIKDMI